jgi:hypothetical protein
MIGDKLIVEQHDTERATMEFHLSRQARDFYRFDEALFTLRGNILFANFHAARVFAQKMNDRRDLVSFPEQAGWALSRSQGWPILVVPRQHKWHEALLGADHGNGRALQHGRL